MKTATIEQRIANVCNLFAQQVIYVLGTSTLHEIASLGDDAQNSRRGASTARKALLAEIGRMPLPCPVSGCQERGVRSKRNFCMGHAEEVPAAEQERLRAAQRAAKGRRGGL